MDVFTREQRSSIMSRIRSRGNKTTELRFVRLLRTNKITGWRRGSSLPGRPDFVFAKRKLVIFIDGDFWHGNPIKFRTPRTNRRYWRQKIRRNQERDEEITSILESRGWRVARFWESSLRDERATVDALKIALALDV
jgi:DNA mismatch endonuclease (patch repair protein)